MENEIIHVGIIMDGNRRWAKEKNLKSLEGHRAGADRICSLAKHVFDKGIKYLSIYAFSTENFNRSVEEVGYLMDLLIATFNNKLKNLAKDNIRVVFSGRRENLSDKVLACIDKVTELTKNNTGGTLNVCFNYGSKSEIVDACNKLIKDNKEITEENISKYLYQEIPPLDLVIRTSGEYRLSNFMLWQASYAELYFTKVYFPDFDEHEFDLALDEYNHRHRRFGGN